MFVFITLATPKSGITGLHGNSYYFSSTVMST